MPDEKIRETLYQLAGSEIAILAAMEDKDWEYVKTLKVIKNALLKQLRNQQHGLKED